MGASVAYLWTVPTSFQVSDSFYGGQECLAQYIVARPLVRLGTKSQKEYRRTYRMVVLVFIGVVRLIFWPVHDYASGNPTPVLSSAAFLCAQSARTRDIQYTWQTIARSAQILRHNKQRRQMNLALFFGTDTHGGTPRTVL